MRSAGAGEIVDVPGGGRIVRSAAGRKDRHSKVCTAKGPRDRRVRLAAHTAIQFYDVQDRLGYDRPSKAVDWLMKKAKSAIDALDELPSAWRPPPPVGNNNNNNNNLLPPSMESDSIADTIKSFFPMGGHEGSPAMQFQSYPSSDCKQSQDLKLSLQSLHDPMRIQSHHHSNQSQEGEDQQRSQFGSHPHQGQEEQDQQQSQFPGAAQIGFGHPSPNWDDESQHQTDSGRLQRLIGWNFGGYGGGGGNGFMFNPPPHLPPQTSLQQQQMLLSNGGGHSSSHLYPQGGPLQSNFTPLATATSSQDHHHHHHHDQSVAMHPTMSFPGIGLGSSGGFFGFRIPARIQGGDEEEQDGNPNKPFSLSSASRH